MRDENAGKNKLPELMEIFSDRDEEIPELMEMLSDRDEDENDNNVSWG